MLVVVVVLSIGHLLHVNWNTLTPHSFHIDSDDNRPKYIKCVDIYQLNVSTRGTGFFKYLMWNDLHGEQRTTKTALELLEERMKKASIFAVC